MKRRKSTKTIILNIVGMVGLLGTWQTVAKILEKNLDFFLPKGKKSRKTLPPTKYVILFNVHSKSTIHTHTSPTFRYVTPQYEELSLKVRTLGR